jgi:hypothetical protein
LLNLALPIANYSLLITLVLTCIILHLKIKGNIVKRQQYERKEKREKREKRKIKEEFTYAKAQFTRFFHAKEKKTNEKGRGKRGKTRHFLAFFSLLFSLFSCFVLRRRRRRKKL